MIYKVEDGLYKVELSTKLSKPNVNGFNYNINSFHRAMENMLEVHKVLSKTDQTDMNLQGDMAAYMSVNVADVLGKVTEVNYEADEPYIMVESIDDFMAPYMEGDFYAGARLLADMARNSEMLNITYFVCWDLVPVCNWK